MSTSARRTVALLSLVLALILLACAGAPGVTGQLRGSLSQPAPVSQEAGDWGLQPPNDKPYADTFFENYGVNPSIDTEDDHLSTFALDVDTGSYTITRSYIHQGNLPPKDAVRVEEFVNYFRQDYDYPAAGDAFAIYVDGAPVPFSQTERYQMIRIGIQGYAVPADERQDVHLTFVIDVSGSMDMEDRLGLVKRSLQLLVDQLRPTDSVSIVVYGDDARVVLEPTSGEEKETITRAIQRLQSEGATNAEAGLRLGYQMAAEAMHKEGIHRVILCSDGVANVGQTGADSILAEIEEYAAEGITLTTVGFGMENYNDVLMEQLADKGDGFYAYVDTFNEARRLFLDNLTSTLQIIAQDAKVQVDFSPEVVSRYRLVGFENRAIEDDKFRDDSVDAGEIGAGHNVTALYEIKLHPDAEGRIATVYLRWADPDTQEVTEISRDFTTEEMQDAFDAASPRFQWDVVVAECAEVLRESYWAQDSTLSGVLEEARRVAPLLPDDPDVVEFVELMRSAVTMKRVG
ncbi:MAG: YfbK domain-containing protein [Anaerolineae bacterium]|jgi:Ca-activated chloride channel family protein